MTFQGSAEVLPWARELKGRPADEEFPQRWLFRGQSQEHSTIKAQITRPNLDESLRREIQWLYSVGYRIANGITGHHIGRQPWLALFQHYVGPSPVIDLTGTACVALYFALLGAKVGDRAVVYAFDAHKLVALRGATLVEHDFLLLPLREGGAKCRWLKQDGFGVCHQDWSDIGKVANLDLLAAEPNTATFVVTNEDMEWRAGFDHLLSLEGDPLPPSIRGALTIAVEQLAGPKALSPALRKYVEDVSPPTDQSSPLVGSVSRAPSREA